MRLRHVGVIAAAGLLLLPPRVADGQGLMTRRLVVAVSAGVQPDGGSLSQTLTLTRNVEPAPVRATMPRAAAPLFDAGVTVKLFRRVGAGMAVSIMERSADASIGADIPHPFFFNQPRAIEGIAPGLRRAETAIHAFGAYTLTFGRALLSVTAGPTFFRAEQGFITDVRHTDEYPYDTAEYAGADVRTVAARRAGYHAGVDVTWRVTGRWGLGALTRFSRARSAFSRNGQTLGTVDLGGLQVAAGARVGF